MNIFNLFAETVTTEEQNSEPEMSSDLYRRTLTIDINSSDFYELTAWCRRLGINPSGSASEMRSRLFNYYNVESETSKKTSEQIMNLITIESADKLDYFTIEKIDENYVKILGNVILTMTDEKNSDTHQIKADSILFNFKENFLTASGNIEYILKSNDKTENFKGEKITFNVETWEGLFHKGVSEEVQEKKDANDEDLTFYFKGEIINKTDENHVVLEKGEITSCDMEDPHFRLKAEKLWLLSGDEWAVASGILYIGRVPVLYIPGYLNAGDELFFNPVFGYMNNFGYYIQTTTYLIGKKEESDTSFSFLQSDESVKFTKTRGMFLVEDENPSNSKKDFMKIFDENDYLKLIFDFYSNPGFYSAVEGKIKKLSFLNDINIFASLAVTRKIEASTSGYTHLFQNDEGVYSSILENSYFYIYPLPFRFGLDLNYRINLDWLSINMKLEHFSDKNYRADFSLREENLDLLELIAPDNSTSIDPVSSVNNTKWEFRSTINPDVRSLNPYIKRFSINEITTSLNWQAKNIEDNETNPELFNDTVSTFFYPDSYIFPSASASISGEFFSFSTTEKKIEVSDKDSENEKGIDSKEISLYPPMENPEPVEIQKNIDNVFILPGLIPDNEIDTEGFWNPNDLFSNKITYSLNPRFADKTQFKTSEWQNPLEIDPDNIEYSFTTSSVNASLNYSAAFINNLFKIDNAVNFTGRYSRHYNMESLSEDFSQKYQLEDNQSTDMNIKNNLSLKINPLLAFVPVKETQISYSLNNTLYSYDYSLDENSYIDIFPDFSVDSITEHKLKLYIPISTENLTQNFSFETSVPPLALLMEGFVSFEYGIGLTEFSTSFKEVENIILYDPLTINQKILFLTDSYILNGISFNYTNFTFEQNLLEGSLNLFDKKFQLKTKYIHDFVDDGPSALSIDLKIYDYYLKFSAYNTYDYNFDLDSGWQQVSDQQFLPVSLSTGFNIKSGNQKFWKNRFSTDYTVDSSIKMNLIRFTDSSLNFSFKLNVNIFEFLQLKFETVSENRVLYRYIPFYTDELGLSTINIFTDLLKSFNIFNIEDRYKSNFNLKSINLALVHDLHDWDLNIEYSGRPFINDNSGVPSNDWENILNIYLKWKAVPEIKTEIEIDKGDLSF